MGEEYFRELLRKKGLRVTRQRLTVLEAMAEHPGEHLTAEQVYDLVRMKYPEIGLATVYRTVQVLVELQVIDRISFDDGFVRYEFGQRGREGRHHHHHAICVRCGAVLPFEEDLLEKLEQEVFARTGFAVEDHEVKLYGCCRACREAKQGKIESGMEKQATGSGDKIKR